MPSPSAGAAASPTSRRPVPPSASLAAPRNRLEREALAEGTIPVLWGVLDRAAMNRKQVCLLLCVLLCVTMLFIDNRRLMEPEELPINCASCAWNKIDTRLISVKPSPEQARAKVYFHE